MIGYLSIPDSNTLMIFTNEKSLAHHLHWNTTGDHETGSTCGGHWSYPSQFGVGSKDMLAWFSYARGWEVRWSNDLYSRSMTRRVLKVELFCIKVDPNIAQTSYMVQSTINCREPFRSTGRQYQFFFTNILQFVIININSTNGR